MSAVEGALRQSGDDPLATGRVLHTDAVLEGSVQRIGDQVRVTAQLLRVGDGKQLWSGSFDEESAQVFRIQDAISEQLVSGLSLKLGEGERERLTRRHTQNPEAYRLYLLGRYFWRTDQQKSRQYHQQALAVGSFLRAGSRRVGGHLRFWWPSTKRTLPKNMLAKRLRLDESLAEPHATLGFVQMFSRWQWDEAGKELKRALDLNPGYPTAHQWYALYLACIGRTTEAVARMQRALELDPLSAAINADMGQMYFFAGDLERAETACRKALELRPNYNFALLYLFYIHAKAGRDSETVESFLRFIEEFRPAAENNNAPGAGGLRDVLLQDIAFLSTRSRNPKSYNRIAEDYALLGDKEQALHWLEKSVSSQNFFMAFIKVNPLFEDLREEPRYKTLVERVGLTP